MSDGSVGPWDAAAAEILQASHQRLYPGNRCWIGTTTSDPPKWEVSNGGVGGRSHACEWDSAREAIDYARWLGLQVSFEEDFRWD